MKTNHYFGTNNSLHHSTEGEVEVISGQHRGFAIVEFVNINKVYEVGPDYCPDPDDGGRIPGRYTLVIDRLYRAVRSKNGEEKWLVRGYSVDEVKQQINANIGKVRR